MHAHGLFPQIFLLILQVVVLHFASISPLDTISTKLINRFHCNWFFPDTSESDKLVSCRKATENDALYFILLSQRWATLLHPPSPASLERKKIRYDQRCHLCVQTLLSRNSYVIFTCILYSRPYLKEIFCHHRSAADGLTRSRSLKKTLNTPTAIKKNSHCLQLIYQVVSGLLLIFIHFFL